MPSLLQLPGSGIYDHIFGLVVVHWSVTASKYQISDWPKVSSPDFQVPSFASQYGSFVSALSYFNQSDTEENNVSMEYSSSLSYQEGLEMRFPSV